MQIILTVFLLFFAFNAEAQVSDKNDGKQTNINSQELQLILDGKEKSLILLAEKIAALEEERETGFFNARNAYYESLVNYYKYQEDLRQRTIATLRWQTISSYLLLILVMSVTLFGGYLSYREVIKALGAHENLTSHTPTDDIERGNLHTLVLEANKIQITSAVTGVIILVISLGFLYLFVDRVMDLSPVKLGDGITLGTGNRSVDDSATVTQ